MGRMTMLTVKPHVPPGAPRAEPHLPQGMVTEAGPWKIATVGIGIGIGLA